MYADAEKYRDHIVVQTDWIGDYERAGWTVLVFDKNDARLIEYGHCSCFGTWDGGVPEDKTGQPKWDWTGSVDELIAFAKAKGDPHMHERSMTEEDYGWPHLRDAYDEFLKWAANHGYDV